MEHDPREEKLPKWARDILERQRILAALAWPSQPRPSPLWEPGSNVFVPSHFDGAIVWQAIPSLQRPECLRVNKSYLRRNGSSIGFRPENGRFFDSKREAVLDMWWSRAETAAQSLYEMRAALAAGDQTELLDNGDI